MHLVNARRKRPLVSLLIEDESGVDGIRLAMQRRHYLLGARHLGHQLWIDEARRLHSLQACAGEAVAELRAHHGFQRLRLVLQAVTRADVADDHIDKGRGLPDQVVHRGRLRCVGQPRNAEQVLDRRQQRVVVVVRRARAM